MSLTISVNKKATFINGEMKVEIVSEKPLTKRLERAFYNLPCGVYHVEFYGSFATICTMIGSETCILKDVRVKNK